MLACHRSNSLSNQLVVGLQGRRNRQVIQIGRMIIREGKARMVRILKTLAFVAGVLVSLAGWPLVPIVLTLAMLGVGAVYLL